MERIRIVVDSAADLAPEDVAEYEIDVVSQVVTMGREAYEDTALTRDEFWELATRGAPGTSQPPVGAFEKAYERWVPRGYRVLCFTVTGRHSGTYNSARTAALAYGDRVTVVDTLSLSAGQGWQALAAAQMARLQIPLNRILDALQSIRQRTHCYILLDSLGSLRRGGRADRLMPFIDRLMRTLNLKPMIVVVEGELKLFGVVRSYQKGLERMKQEMARIAPLERLAVLHTRRAEVAQQLADELAALVSFPREQILVAETGAVLACHAGAGVSAVFGLSKG